MVEITQGVGDEPGLPPIALPSLGTPPPRPRITIPVPMQPPAQQPAQQPAQDPWAAFPTEPPAPEQQQGAAEASSQADPWAAFPTEPPVSPPKEKRQTTLQEAQVGGLKEGLTLGAAPYIAGAAEASGIEAPNMMKVHEAGDLGAITDAVKYFGRPFVGAAKMLINSMSDHPDPGVQAAYHRGTQSYLEDQQLQHEQHPIGYLAGQLYGALLGPKFGALKGTTPLGRVTRSTIAGGVGGGIYGANTSISENEDLGDVLKNTGLGVGAGALFGTAGGAVAEGLGAAGSKIGTLIRGKYDPEAEAARKAGGAVWSDLQRTGRKFTPEELQVAKQAGVPLIAADLGGGRTMSTMRSAANTSPEAREALEKVTQERFYGQSSRIGAYIRYLSGGARAVMDDAALQHAGRMSIRPRYNKTYIAGDRPLFSPRLEQLASTPAVGQAARGAVERGQNRAVLDGFGAFNPKVMVTPDGRVVFPKGPTGVPTYPNIQFWDYTQRELADAASAAERAGRKEEAMVLGALKDELNKELDKLVPEFNAARGTAATFFGARDALEAGQKFVLSGASLDEARKAIAAMTPAERILFARGFASELVDKIEKLGFGRDVVNQVFGSKASIDKIRLALSPEQARKLEALLRVESLIDAPRKALGNSTTARQTHELGLAGGAVAAVEGAHAVAFDPVGIIVSMLTLGSLRAGAKKIDENVARHVGELLASNDPKAFAKGLNIVSSSPLLFGALRTAMTIGTRTGVHAAGPTPSLAAGAEAATRLWPFGHGEHGHKAEVSEDTYAQ